jgi:glycosyltransferase-like protein
MPSPERPLNIALLTHSVNPRGGVVHTLELGEALQQAGHRVTVMAPARAGQRWFRPTRCETVRVPVPPHGAGMVAMVAARIAAYRAFLTAWPQRERVDIWHAQDSISGNALAELKRCGLIAGFVRTVHHLDVFDEPQLMAWQQRAFAEAGQVFCVSRLWCETMRRAHGIAAQQVPNGVDLQRFSPQPQAADAEVARRFGLRPGAPLWLALGGIEQRKNTRQLIAAFIALRQRQPQAQLLIAGGASLLDHEAYARACGADAAGLPSGALVLAGPVAQADLPSLYRLADALVMPSLNEGFGLVVLEALASGTPVVVSRIAPFTEYLGDEVEWVDPLDARSIAAGMARAAQRPRQAEPAAVCHRFSWAASAERHLALYQSPSPQPSPAREEGAMLLEP